MIPSADNAIEIRSLTKCYGRSIGVEDLSFNVARGEVFGYLGPNGSGKTTTIRCLMGLLHPTRGRCRILGETVRTGMATGHASVGYLPGDFRVWPELPARESLKVLAQLNGGGPGRRREELAETLELDMDRPVRDLSKGNRQKVGVVYAFETDPELLILDEPTSGLDPLMRQAVLRLIREAAWRGAAVLLSSHDLSEVAAVCGRAAILREGRLVEMASVTEIVQQGERHLRVWFKPRAATPNVPLDRLEGVRVIATEPGSLHLGYHGSIDRLLKWLADQPVDRIATPESSLEQAFIQYYPSNHDRDDNTKGGAS
ncbi:MAG: ABC transporter ATP-binding protein [Planctomycetota bacterium]